MRLRQLTLQNFRNVAFTRLELSGRQQAFIGPNGQGKTNLLEGVGFISALRSFRSADPSVLIAQGQTEAAIRVELEHEVQGSSQLLIKLRPGSKEVWVEQTRVTRLADFLGQYPTVVFSSQDQQLIRGSPAGRRRWLDLTLASVNREYFETLQAYHRALAGRNALLKRQAGDAEIAAFERPLAEAGARLLRERATGLLELGRAVTAAYSVIADAAEPVTLAYRPDLPEPEALLPRLGASRVRDRQLRSTTVGPHRDDFEFRLRELPAKEFGSEGQQRTLVLALRLAQAAHFRERRGIQPVLLADDVLGELDPSRRARFWTAIPADAQVLATGTVPPDPSLGAWQQFQVSAGSFSPVTAAA